VRGGANVLLATAFFFALPRRVRLGHEAAKRGKALSIGPFLASH
jgi:hypothetical protein